MKFSIITCTRNSAATLKECIDSVNYQTFSDIGHVFVDGNSSDDTHEIIQLLAKRDVKVISESPSGIYNALNTGIKNSEGEIIGILHSDDVFSGKNVLSEVHEKFLETQQTLFMVISSISTGIILKKSFVIGEAVVLIAPL
jgi:glycosyltransferase